MGPRNSARARSRIAVLVLAGLLALVAAGCGSSSHTPSGLNISGPGLQTSQPASGPTQPAWKPEYAHLAQRLKLIGIPAGGKEKFHIHVLLHIYVNGLLTPLAAQRLSAQPQQVPAQRGGQRRRRPWLRRHQEGAESQKLLDDQSDPRAEQGCGAQLSRFDCYRLIYYAA